MADSDHDSYGVSEFLEAFPTYHLHRRHESYGNLYVFDTQDEGGSQDNSSSADRQTTGTIQDKIKSALLSETSLCPALSLILQFWAPVEIGARQLLSTSGQLFAVKYPHKDLIEYRQRCTEYEYEHSNPMIITTSDPPTTAFLNRLPHKVDFSKHIRSGTPTQYALEIKRVKSIMLPICCCPPQSSSTCVGVLEYSSSFPLSAGHLNETIKALKEAGLGIIDVQDHIPYKTLHGLKPARDQIRHAIENVCKSHKLICAQVWIAYHEDKNQVPFLLFFEYARKKHMLALKLTGTFSNKWTYLREYCDLCDMIPLDTGESLVEKTLQDYKSRFYTTYDRLNKNQIIMLDYDYNKVNGIVIWLKSIDTGDFGYAFEFFWNSDYDFSLEDLLLTLKGHLPSFKFSSGAELGDELHVIDVENSTESDIRSLKIFKGKGKSLMPEALEEGKKRVVVKDITHLEMNCKSAPIDIHGEDIELQFEKTQKEAAKNLEDVGNSIKRDSKRFKVQALEEGKKPAVVEDKESLKAKQKTTPIELPYAEIKKRFGKTQSEAAKDLNDKPKTQ